MHAVELLYKNQKIAALCTEQKQAIRRLGPEQAKRLQQRIDDLIAAPTLASYRPGGLPGRCHELTADRTGQLSLDLKHPYRLIFVPGPSPAPTMSSGGLDWNAVTAIQIVEITDTHE